MLESPRKQECPAAYSFGMFRTTISFTLTNGSDTKYGWCDCRIADIMGIDVSLAGIAGMVT